MNYIINPLISFKKSFCNTKEFLINVGEGSRRQEFSVSDRRLLRFLVNCIGSKSYIDLVEQLSENYSYTVKDSELLIHHFIQNELLIEAKHIEISLLKWEKWEWRDALNFHTATRNMIWRHSYKSNADKPPIMTYNLDDKLIKPDRPKPLGKIIDEKWIKHELPLKSDCLTYSSFYDSIYNRKTNRFFKKASIKLQTLSDLLNHVCQPILLQNARPFRATPTYSLGKFYNIYLLVNNVENMQSGVYLYKEEENVLYKIKSGNQQKNILKTVQEQPFVNNLSLGIIISVNWDQYIWKYRFSRTYRLALFEIGGIAQSILTIATALNLSTFLTPAIDDKFVEEILEIKDNLMESPLYFIGVGHPENKINKDDPRNQPL